MLFRLALAVFFLCSFSFGDWIVKMGSKTYQDKDFQEFVDYTRYVLGVSGQKLPSDDEAKYDLLKKFIDNEIVLAEAKKKGIDGETPEVKSSYQEAFDKWLTQVYLAAHLDIKGINPSEADIKAEFEKLKSSGGAQGIPASMKYSDAPESLKSQVGQKLYMEKVNKIKDAYREEQEKKFKVKRNGLDSVYVAVVDGERIARSEVEDILRQQLTMAGFSIDEMKKNKGEYDKYRNLVLNDLILNKILKLKIQQENFSSKKEIQVASGFIKKQLILQVFLKKEIYDKIKVSNAEKDAFYKENKNDLKDKPFDEVNGYIEGSIKEKKARGEFSKFMEEKREAYSIQRNLKGLGVIKF